MHFFSRFPTSPLKFPANFPTSTPFFVALRAVLHARGTIQLQAHTYTYGTDHIHTPRRTPTVDSRHHRPLAPPPAAHRRPLRTAHTMWTDCPCAECCALGVCTVFEGWDVRADAWRERADCPYT